VSPPPAPEGSPQPAAASGCRCQPHLWHLALIKTRRRLSDSLIRAGWERQEREEEGGVDGCKAAGGLGGCWVASHHDFGAQKVGCWGQEWSWGLRERGMLPLPFHARSLGTGAGRPAPVPPIPSHPTGRASPKDARGFSIVEEVRAVCCPCGCSFPSHHHRQHPWRTRGSVGA